MDLYQTAIAIEEGMGARVEYVNGLPVWEAFPAARHQMEIDRIRLSIRATPGGPQSCGCVHLADVYVKFPNGSLKRPDISVFCRVPDEMTTAITLPPEAVIEIISPDYKAKDIQVGVPFYIAQGVRDVVIFDPDTNEVIHYRDGQPAHLASPAPLEFACGCSCTV